MKSLDKNKPKEIKMIINDWIDIWQKPDSGWITKKSKGKIIYEDKPKEPVTDTNVGIKTKELECWIKELIKDYSDLVFSEEGDCLKTPAGLIKRIQSLLTQQRIELLDESCEKAETEAEIASKAYEQGYLDCQKGRKKAPHDTREGYCCACDYDLAYFEGKLKESRTELLEEIKKLNKEELHCCGVNEDGTSNCPAFCIGVEYNRALKDITNLLNKKDE